VSYGEVLGYKSTLGRPYTEGTRLYCDYFISCITCTVVVFDLLCNVGVCVCVGVLVIRVLYLLCFVLFLLHLFVLFRLCTFILICFVCTSVRITATE